MTPKEKVNELINQAVFTLALEPCNAVIYADQIADEIISIFGTISSDFDHAGVYKLSVVRDYWKEVKEEIEKL